MTGQEERLRALVKRLRVVVPALYHIAQEAPTGTVEHARARHVSSSCARIPA